MIRDSRTWFAFSALLLLGTLVAATIVEGNHEWEGYQETYRELAIERAPDARVREAAERMEIKLQQVFLPDLHRVDRCVSCHLGVENPQMANAPQPFTLHPGNYLKHHRVDRFGCTICHQGQGRATNAREAHGHVPHWESPMLREDLVEASCGRCHAGEVVEGAPKLTRGRQLIGDLGCRGCHVIQGIGASVGPVLTGVATRDVNADHKLDAKDWEWHFEHFADPRTVSKGSVMPRFGLSEDDIRALTVAMLALSDEEIHQEYHALERPAPIREIPDVVQRGRRVWRRYGCAGCHGREGRGGIENPNTWGGHVPGLAKYAAGLVPDQETARRLQGLIDDAYRRGASLETVREPWLERFHAMRQKIVEGVVSVKRNPDLQEVPLDMPPWGDVLTNDEINDVIAYAVSLFPAAKVQPIAFNHKLHGDKGLECSDCHVQVREGLQATLPNLEVCADCHDEALTDSAEEKKLLRHVEWGKEVAWVRLGRLADHVVFSHKRHVVAGEIACEECHGEIGQATAPPPHALVHLDMTFCMDCHRKVGAKTECNGCHR